MVFAPAVFRIGAPHIAWNITRGIWWYVYREFQYFTQRCLFGFICSAQRVENAEQPTIFLGQVRSSPYDFISTVTLHVPQSLNPPLSHCRADEEITRGHSSISSSSQLSFLQRFTRHHRNSRAELTCRWAGQQVHENCCPRETAPQMSTTPGRLVALEALWVCP